MSDRELLARAQAHAQFCEARLFHAWTVIRQQQKGLRRQAKKIARLKAAQEAKND